MDACQNAASDPMLLATDLADWLVKEGVPFRSAHELVGKAVAESIASKTPLETILGHPANRFTNSREQLLLARNHARRGEFRASHPIKRQL